MIMGAAAPAAFSTPIKINQRAANEKFSDNDFWGSGDIPDGWVFRRTRGSAIRACIRREGRGACCDM
jgi:hypothetical protein